MNADGYQMVAIKRRFVPEWVFALAVYSCRFFETDMARVPRLRRLLTTENFHYHDVGRAVYGKRCRKCLPEKTA